MFEERVAYRYAKAIFDTAVQAKVEEQLFQDFQFVDKVFASTPELTSMARKPIISSLKKKRIYESIFKGKISDLALSSLFFLVDKSRDYLIRSIIAQYQKLYYYIKGYLPIEIYFAVEISQDLRTKIIEKIEENTGKKIVPKIIINPKILGGFILKINDWVFDTSLQNKLKILYEDLTKESIIETNKG